MKTKFTFLILMFLSMVSMAQQNNDVEMADALRSSGKIYVVVAVICVIFIGLIIYLFSIDRRVRNIERNK
jgi:hypothetical protein